MIRQVDAATEATHPTVRLRARPDQQTQLEVDVDLCRLPCAVCGTWLPGSYELGGSRYGHVGSITCPCGARVTCVDNDFMRDELKVHAQGPDRSGVRQLDFRELFRLAADDLQQVAGATGYDLHGRHSDGTVSLGTVVDELATHLGTTGTPPGAFEAPALPAVVRRWFGLLRAAGVATT